MTLPPPISPALPPPGTRVRDRLSGQPGVVALYDPRYRHLGLFPVFWPNTGQTTTCSVDDLHIPGPALPHTTPQRVVCNPQQRRRVARKFIQAIAPQVPAG